jgi:hypothetical protein
MPLKLNLGLSRKVGESNYGSRGASINVEVEIESALLSEPARLKERIRQTFGLVREALADELNGSSNGKTHAEPRNGNGATTNSDSRKSPPVRPATDSQLRAINSIAKRQQVNLDELLHQRFHLGRIQDLSIRQASQLIDELKAPS